VRGFSTHFRRLDASVPGTGITIGINERYLRRHPHLLRRVAHAQHLRRHVSGILGVRWPDRVRRVSPALESRITRLAFSHANHRYMAKNDGRPLPQLTRLVKQGYRQLSPTQERKLRSSTLCIATDSRLGMLCGKAV
jgi:hypothetical protein